MNVFITGATGVLGTPVVQILAGAGHRIKALSRSVDSDALLRANGAEPVQANLFEPQSLIAAVAGSDAILHLATRIPPSKSASKLSAWRENDRIRREGTRNLVDAALRTEVSTLVYPGITFVYPDRGAEWVDAQTQPESAPILQSSLDAEAEVTRFSQAGGRGIVLRMGAFYGPTAESTDEVLRWARRGIALFFGTADSYRPLIWVEDAARAVVAALLSAPAGVYDAVDDEPLQCSELASALAPVVHRKRLVRPPRLLLRLISGDNSMFLARSQRVSNRRLKETTGWIPTVRSAREGFSRLSSQRAFSNAAIWGS